MAKQRMKTITVRKVNFNGPNIMLQRPGIFGIGWRDWKLMNNELHLKDQQIAKQCDVIKKLLEERDQIEAALKAEKKEISNDVTARSGYSEPFQIQVPSKEYRYKRIPDVLPVDGKWREVINPKLLSKKPKPTGIRAKMGLDDSKTPVRSAYSLKDVEHLNKAILEGGEYDNVMTYREPQENKSKNPRKKRPGESDREHQARLKRMKDSRNTDPYDGDYDY